MSKTNELILLEEARKSFDLIDNEAEKLFKKINSYLYVNLFLLTSFFALFKYIKPDLINSYIGIIFLFTFLSILFSGISTLITLKSEIYMTNPNTEYFTSDKKYDNKNFILELISIYEETTDFNSKINKRLSSWLRVIYYTVFLSIALLITIILLYIMS